MKPLVIPPAAQFGFILTSKVGLVKVTLGAPVQPNEPSAINYTSSDIPGNETMLPSRVSLLDTVMSKHSLDEQSIHAIG